MRVFARCLQINTRINILSETLAPTTASVIAAYDDFDLALLRVGSQISAPATLRINDVAPNPSEILKAYGYPADADLRRPSVTDTTLVNDRFAGRAKGAFADPRFLVLLDSPVDVHGFSGGPVVDRFGSVVGVVRGRGIKIDGATDKDPEFDRIWGAMGIRFISRLTANVEFKRPVARIRVAADDDGKTVQAAIVRVVCWTSDEK